MLLIKYVIKYKCNTKDIYTEEGLDDRLCTHVPENLPISAIAYFINTLDSQSSGHGRGRPNYFKVTDFFYKILTHGG